MRATASLRELMQKLEIPYHEEILSTLNEIDNVCEDIISLCEENTHTNRKLMQTVESQERALELHRAYKVSGL